MEAEDNATNSKINFHHIHIINIPQCDHHFPLTEGTTFRRHQQIWPDLSRTQISNDKQRLSVHSSLDVYTDSCRYGTKDQLLPKA